jgi:hypothetical protein
MTSPKTVVTLLALTTTLWIAGEEGRAGTLEEPPAAPETLQNQVTPDTTRTVAITMESGQ